MVKDINHNLILLAQKSTPAGREDMSAAKDLLDTLEAHKEECVGMAANMIGIYKNIIAINMGLYCTIMFNPMILNKSNPYVAEEGCLSVPGVKKTTRYLEITLRYQDTFFEWKTEKFSGFVAEIIQHEMDHLQGVLI